MSDEYIRCPFWRERRKDRYTIGCEGLTDKMRIILTWIPGAKSEAKYYSRTYCCGRYDACEIYQAIMRAKYDGGA